MPCGVDSGAVIKTLNKTCVNSLQAAAGLCLSRTNYSVEVEHWLLKLTEEHDTDLARIFRHFEVNTSHLQRDLTKTLDRLKTGNARADPLARDRRTDPLGLGARVASVPGPPGPFRVSPASRCSRMNNSVVSHATPRRNSPKSRSRHSPAGWPAWWPAPLRTKRRRQPAARPGPRQLPREGGISDPAARPVHD